MSYLSYLDKRISFDRVPLCGNLTGKKFNFRGITIAKSKIRCVFSDELMKSALSVSDYLSFQKTVSDEIFTGNILNAGSNEDVFRFCEEKRKSLFGDGVYKNLYKKTNGKSHTVNGISQEKLLGGVYKKETLVLYLSEPEFIPDFTEFVKQNENKNLYCLVSEEICSLPTKNDIKNLGVSEKIKYLSLENCLGIMDICRLPLDTALQKAVEEKKVGFVGFGEDALMTVRRLKMPAAVKVVARSYYGKAVTGVFDEKLTNEIFIPENFDIFPFIPIIDTTAVSYYQLSFLSEKFGERVYSLSANELRKLCPKLFLNVYDYHFPPVLNNGFTYSGGSFKKQREEYFVNLLSDIKGIKYLHSCFKKDTWQKVGVDWEAETKQNQILVDGVIASGETAVSAELFDSAVSPRDYFFNKKDGRFLVSNFAFFFTDDLRAVYNKLISDRQREQINFPVGYIDYLRYTDKNGRRHETFPLFNKACLARQSDGKYTAFSFSLCGGSITLSGEKFDFSKSDVNPENAGDIAVYTPYISQDESSDNAWEYKKTVGKDRLNIVIIGEDVLLARQGDVYLPPIGVVLSLSGKEKDRLKEHLKEENDGYLKPDFNTVSVCLSAPDGIKSSVWDNLCWVFGGGLSLYENNEAITEKSFNRFLKSGGWLSSLSQQTQESALHTVASHPRTAVGVTKKGELFVLVFSGRTNVSAGANYFEICEIAKRMIDDIDFIINYDGGGSSVLGLADDNIFTEITYCAPSNNSLTGMARKINSMLLIKL